MDSEDSEAREDSASEDSHPSTDGSENSVEVRVVGVSRPSHHLPSPTADDLHPSNYSPPPPPLLSLLRSSSNQTPSLLNLPLKLRKSYLRSLTQRNKDLGTDQLKVNSTPENIFDSSSDSSIATKISPNGGYDSEVQSPPRRRKPAEPRRLCSSSENSLKRSRSPELPTNESPCQPLKQLRTSPPPVRKEESDHVNISRTPSPAPPNFRIPPLSPIVVQSSFPSNFSNALSSSLASRLLPAGWPNPSSYQNLPQLLTSALASPLALLPGALPLHSYHSLLPLLHNLPHQYPLNHPVIPQQATSIPSEPILQPKASKTPERIETCPESEEEIEVSVTEPEKDEIFINTNQSSINVASIVGELIQSKKDQIQKLKPTSSNKQKVQVDSKIESKISQYEAPPNTNKPKQVKSPKNSNVKQKLKEASTSRRLLRTDSKNLELCTSIAGPSISPSSDVRVCTNSDTVLKSEPDYDSQQSCSKNKQRNYKNMTRERRIEANARERTRVHTISSAYEKLRSSVPSYSHNQKLSKLSILRIAASYIMTLSKMTDESPNDEVKNCVEDTTKTIQFEGKAKKKRED